MFEMELDTDIIAVRLARLKMTCGAVGGENWCLESRRGLARMLPFLEPLSEWKNKKLLQSFEQICYF
jgi:hypothetical protein